MNVNDMEQLLQRRADNGSHIISAACVPVGPEGKPSKAIKSASLQDFVEMVSMLVAKTMKKDGVVLKPDEGARPIIDPEKQLDAPVIFYEVIERVPKMELKPREREEIQEFHDDEKRRRQGRVWGQKFACLVQFNFLACDYRAVNSVMNDFEGLIFNYTPYFKKNGVAEILFKKHFTDKNLGLFRQTLSVRSLQYYLEIEKLTAVFETEIEEITIV